MSEHGKRSDQLRERLDDDLREASAARGATGAFTAQELTWIDLACESLDRADILRSEYHVTNDPKVMAKLSGELRQLEGAVARLVARVRIEFPKQESLTSIKARRAVNKRWEHERGRNG